MIARSRSSIDRAPSKPDKIRAFARKKKKDGRGGWCDLIRINNRISKAIMSRAPHVLMLDKRIKHFGKCVRVSRDSHVQYALGSSSIAQPFDSLCSKVFDEHPTVATPKEQEFCAATSQNQSSFTLDTPAQINFNSTVGHKCARMSIDHHRRTPTSRNTLWASVFKNTCVEVFATHVRSISSGLRAIDTYEQSWVAYNSLTN